MEEFFRRIFDIRIGEILSLLEYTDEIIGITAIIVTLLVTNGDDTKTSFLKLAKRCVFVCTILCILVFSFSQKWCFIPDLYGQSYSIAMESLQNVGIQGVELLPQSHNPEELDVRVVWQSKEKGSISAKEDTVFMVLASIGGYEYNPLHIDTSKIHENDWIWIEDQGIIKIQLPSVYSNIRHDQYDSVTFEILSDKLGIVLESVILNTLSEVTSVIKEDMIDQYHLVGKLYAHNKEDYRTKEIQVSFMDGILFLPVVMYDDDYNLSFSFYDKENNHYDHSIPVQFIPEVLWDY